MRPIRSILAAAACAATAGLAYAAPITTGAPFVYRDHEGPNTIGSGTGDNLTVVVPNVSPNLTTTAFVTNPQVPGNPPLLNVFTSPFGFFSRSFAGDVSADAGSVTQPSTVTFQNSADTLSVGTNGTAGVQQLPLLTNLAIGGSALAPTLSWDAVATAVPYNQVRLSIYNDRTDQAIISERNIGPAGTVGYTVPLGTLAPNTDYAFRIFLWDNSVTSPNTPLNRSSTHINYRTTSSALGVGNNQITGPVPGPLTLLTGANNYPNTAMSFGFGGGGAGAVTLTNGTTLAGSFVAVGNGNLGTLVVDDTTVVLIGSDVLPPSSGGFLTAGRFTNGRGFVDVINGGRIEINSSEFANPGLNVGRDATSFGTVNVDGANSTIAITGPTVVSPTPSDNGVVNVGRIGDGRLNITNGGKVVNAAAGRTSIGRDTGSRGSVLVSGAGSMLDAGSQLYIGFNDAPIAPATGPGEGVLRIENGGLVLADATKLGPGGLLTGNGGILQSTLMIAGGVGSPGASPGKTTIIGDLIIEEGRLQLEAFGPGQIDAIEVTGTIEIGANATIEIQLGYVPTGPLVFLTAGDGIEFDANFAGPQVVGVLGTEAQGMDGATIAIVIGDRTYDTPVQVPPIDPSVDYDGDGVADGEDDCPGSSAEPKLLIGTCDTGAANSLLGRGCKLSDAVRTCELGMRNHGDFVSCVAGNANKWLLDRTISPELRGSVQACAAGYGPR